MYRLLNSYVNPRLDRLTDKTLQKEQPKNSGQLNNSEKAAFALLRNALISPFVPLLSGQHRNQTLDVGSCYTRTGYVQLPDQEDEATQPVGYFPARSQTWNGDLQALKKVHGRSLGIQLAPCAHARHRLHITDRPRSTSLDLNSERGYGNTSPPVSSIVQVSNQHSAPAWIT